MAGLKVLFLLMLNRLGYLRRLRTPEREEDCRRLELRLAYARALVAALCLVMIRLDPTEPPVREEPAFFLLLAYLVFSVLLIFWLRGRAPEKPPLRLVRHAVDLLMGTSFFVLIGGPNNLSFVLLFFLLTSAAVRWALWQTLATAFAAGALIFAGTLFLGPNVLPAPGLEAVPWPHLLVQAGYLLIIGFMLGMISEESKRLAAEKAVVERLSGFLDMEADFNRTMQRICGEIDRLYDSREILVAVCEGPDGPMSLSTRSGCTTGWSLRCLPFTTGSSQRGRS